MSREAGTSMVASLGTSWLEALLEQHTLVRGGQFTVCSCSKQSLDSHRDRHIIEFLGRTHRVAVLPVEDLSRAVYLAVGLLNDLLGVTSPDEWTAVTPLDGISHVCGFIDGLRHAYPAESSTTEIGGEHITDAAYTILCAHRPSELYLIDGDTHVACACGYESVERLFEDHRGSALVSAGIAYGTLVELMGIARTLHNISTGVVFSAPHMDPVKRSEFQSAAGMFRNQVGAYAAL